MRGVNALQSVVNSNLLIALYTIANSFYFPAVYHQSIDFSFSIALGLLTWSIYSLHRILPTYEFGRMISFRLILPIIGLIIGTFLLLSSEPFIRNFTLDILLIFSSSLMTFSYILPLPAEWRIRNLPYSKGLVLAIVWTIVMALVPLDDFQLFGKFWPEITHYFLTVLALCTLFNVKDAEKDKEDKIITLANVFGSPKVQYLCIGLYVLSIVPIFFSTLTLSHLKILQGSISCLGILSTLPTLKGVGKYYYFVVLDGILALFGLIVFLV